MKKVEIQAPLREIMGIIKTTDKEAYLKILSRIEHLQGQELEDTLNDFAKITLDVPDYINLEGTKGIIYN